MFYKKRAMEKLNGKKILVVGATGGIGSSLVKLLHQSGASLFISGRNNEKLLALSQQIGLSSSCMAAVDITSSTEVEQLAVQVNAEMGTLDILINASGIGIIKPLEQLSLEDFMQSLQTNLVGSFLLVKAFLPAMKEVKKGLIINIPGV